MRVPLPQDITRVIAWSASREARSFATSRGWSSANDIAPIWRDGMVGIQVSKKYLMYQERGTKPRVMKELEGKLIPMKDGVVRAVGVGQPGWVTLPGGVRRFRQEKWKHPGIQPTNFMTNSIMFARRAARPEILDLMSTLLGSESSLM